MGLFIRSVVWTVLLPGLLAGYVPWRYLGLRDVRLDPATPAHLVGALGIVLGEYLLAWSRALLLYWALWFTALNLFVIGYQETTLHRLFGTAYDRYRQEVGRWLPRSRR